MVWFDWFGENNKEIQGLFEEKHQKHKAYLRNISSVSMAKFGCPAKFIEMVRQFHDGMLARVQNDGEVSNPFPVTNGVKQGCALASTLFSMMFSAMLTDAFEAHCLEMCTLMMKSMLRLPKLVEHLAGYVEVFGTEMESDDKKLKIYRSGLLQTLLYACETWTVYQRHIKRLKHFHTSCLRKLLTIKWQDRIPDTQVLKRAGMQRVHTLLTLTQLRWTGHVTKMPDERLPKKPSVENYKLENAPIVVRRSDTRTPSKPPLKLKPTNRVVGTDFTGSNKVARPHKKGSW